MDWNERYADKDTPWDTGEPDPHLVELVDSGVVGPGRALEVGCGTGSDALWLAAHGFAVVGLDMSPLAIERAEARRRTAKLTAQFVTLNFLTADVSGGPFDLVFDRGVWHVFDDADSRARFAERVARVLATGGQWLSLAGSTEGPARDHGPPRRTATEMMQAVEPALEIVELRSTGFAADIPSPAKAWLLRARKRDAPAQPSTSRNA